MPRISFVFMCLFVVYVNMTPLKEQGRDDEVEFDDVAAVSSITWLLRYF